MEHWNFIIVDNKEVFRYFGERLNSKQITGMKYVLGAEEPKIRKSRLGVMTYEFRSDRLKEGR